MRRASRGSPLHGHARGFLGSRRFDQEAAPLMVRPRQQGFRAPYQAPKRYDDATKLVGVAGFEPATPTSRTFPTRSGSKCYLYVACEAARSFVSTQGFE